MSEPFNLASVNVSVTPEEKFQEYLATKGMRLTHERSLIVEDVFADHSHFDAEELVERLRKRNVSRATVYRTLNCLEEAGLLRKVARTNDRDVYEHDYGYPQHDHLICGKCGSMTEFHSEALAELLADVAGKQNFLLEGHRLEVYGTCLDCSRPPKRQFNKLDMI